MTLGEVIKLNKPYRRPSWKPYSGMSDRYADPSYSITLTWEDLNATDWEVKQSPLIVWAVVESNGTVYAYYTNLYEASEYCNKNQKIIRLAETEVT